MSKNKTRTAQPKPATLIEMVRDLFGGNTFFNGEGAPLKAHLSEGAADSKVLVVTGSNASGKSFAVRVLASWLNNEKPKVEPLQVSMKYRTEAGMHRAFMFGPFGDAQDSTGTVSLRAIQGGLRTAQGRDSACWLMLDEPDVGLSEDFGYAMGQYLAAEANKGLGENCHGFVVVTHSRELVQGMVDTLEKRPHFAHVDDKPLSIDDWLSGGRRRTVEELLELPTKSVETFRALNKILKD